MPRDGLPLGEPWFKDDGCVFSLSPIVASVSWPSVVGWTCLIDAGFLDSVGEGSGLASFDLFEAKGGSCFFVSILSEPVSTSL